VQNLSGVLDPEEGVQRCACAIEEVHTVLLMLSLCNGVLLR
jgi:hypothetical protein